MELNKIQDLILGCVSELNLQLPSELKVSVSPDLIIVGENATIDSLSLAGLLIDVEEKLQRQLNIKSNLLDEGLNSTFGFKFQTVKELVAWIQQKSTGERK